MTVPSDTIYWARIKPDATIPSKLTEDAGYDIYACFEEDMLIIEPHETKLIPTGIACAMSSDYYMQIEERGSVGSKGVKKSAGVVDSGYRGEIFIATTNTTNKRVIISKQTIVDYSSIVLPYSKAIAQGIIHRVPNLQAEEIPYDVLCAFSSERGIGQLGSSNK